MRTRTHSCGPFSDELSALIGSERVACVRAYVCVRNRMRAGNSNVTPPPERCPFALWEGTFCTVRAAAT